MAAARSSIARSLATLLVSCLVASCSNSPPTKPKVPTASPSPTDATAPMIVVTSPARSAMLAEGSVADGTVAVSGQACDSTNGISNLMVLGNPVSLSGHPTCVSFIVNQSSRWGLSIVAADAASAGGAHGSLVQSYLRSPAYFSPFTSPSVYAEVPSGSVTRLNQEVLDDRDRTDADDIATIVERVLTGADWNTYVPNVLAVSPDANGDGQVDLVHYDCPFRSVTHEDTGYRVARGGALSHGAVHVGYVRASTGKLSTELSVASLSLPFDVAGYLDGGCLPSPTGNVTGTILADNLEIIVSQDITVTSPDLAGHRHLVSNNRAVTVNWTNLRLAVDWGPLSFISGLLDKITNDIIGSFDSKLTNAISGQVGNLVVPNILGSFGVQQSISLSTPNGTLVGVDAGFDSVDVGSGSVQFRTFTQFYPKNPVNGRETLPYGAIRKDGVAPSFSSTAYALGAGIKDDAVNQFLWAAWAGGAYDFDAVTNVSGLPGTIASIRAGLPPVLMPGRNGHAMDLGLGDLRVEYTVPATLASAAPRGASATSGTALFYVSGVAGIGLSIDGATHRLVPTLDPNPEIHVQVESAVGVADTTGLAASIAQAVRSLYYQRIAAVVSAFPLLEFFKFDLGGIPGFPPGATLGLANAAIQRTDDYTVLTGSLEAR